MQTRILTPSEKRQFRADVALVLDFNDVAAATSTVAVPSLSVLAGTKVQCVGLRLVTAFNSGSLTLSIGDGNSATSLTSAVQMATGSTPIAYHVGGSAVVYLVDDTVDVFWTCSNMAKTSGKVVVYLAVEDMNKLPIS